MTDAPSKLADELMRAAKAERAVERLKGPATLEERRALRDAGGDTRANLTRLAEQVIQQRTASLNMAVALVFMRCDSDEDAIKRVRVNEQERSRRRMPLYTVILDETHVWQGAFEEAVEAPGSVRWQERWLVYPGPELSQEKRWASEPRKSLAARDEGGFKAVIVRTSDGLTRMWDGIGDDESAAVATAYERLAKNPGWSM